MESACWHSADDVLDAEEDFDDDLGDAGHDYADLAAAMGSPEEEVHSDQEEDAGSDSELGSGDPDMPTDDEEEDMSLDGDDSVSSGSGARSEGNSDESDQEVDDELNPFELAEGTDSDDESPQKGNSVEAAPAGVPHSKLSTSVCACVRMCLPNHVLLAKPALQP